MANIAEAKDVRDFYTPEIEADTTPSNATLIPFPVEDLGLSPTPLRNPTYARADGGQRTSLGYSGIDYNGEASGALYTNSLDFFLESIFQERFRGAAVTSVTVASNGAIGDQSITLNKRLPAGSVFTIQGSTQVYLVIDNTGTGGVNATISPPLQAAASSGANLDVTFSGGDILINGALPRTFTVQRRIRHGASAQANEQYSGCEATTGSLTIANGENVTLAMNLRAKGLTQPATPSAGLVPGVLTALQKKVIGSGSNIKSVTFKGDADATNLTQAILEPDLDNVTIDFNVEGREEPQRKIGSDDLVGIPSGAMRPSVTARAYFGADYSRFLAAAVALEEFSFVVEMQAVTGQGYRFTFPRCTFGSITKTITGIAPIDVSLPIVPLAANHAAFTAANSAVNDAFWNALNINTATCMVERKV